MKNQACLSGLLAAVVVCLSSCAEEPAGQEAGGKAPAGNASAVRTAEVQTASAAGAKPAAAEPAQDPAKDPANARGGKRYEGGLDKLDVDLSSVKLPDGPAPAEGDEGHDHSAEQAPQPQYGPAAQAALNKGRIALEEGAPQVKDLGKLRQGEVGAFEFPFVSNGEEPLVITGVKPSCGCTKADIELVGADGAKSPYTKGDPIPVGQKFVLESEINTDGRQGPFSAQISIYGNDARGAFNVRLTAEIEPVLTVTPSPTVFFGRITTAQKVEQTVTVAATRGEPFKLTIGQETVQGPIKLDYTPKNRDAEGRASEWEVKVALGPNNDVGMRSYPIQMKSDIPVAHPKYPSQDGTVQYHGFLLNVQAQVTGMVSAEPSFITFGMVRPGEALDRALRIECHDDFQLKADMPVVFEGLQGQEFPFKDLFQVTVEPQPGGKVADLKVHLAGLPQDLNGSFGGVLKVKVGHPFMEELQVRFSGVCRPGLPAAAAPPPQPAVGGAPKGQ
jgi:hypothetical protein